MYVNNLNNRWLDICFICLSPMNEEKILFKIEVDISFSHLENICREIYSELLRMSL